MMALPLIANALYRPPISLVLVGGAIAVVLLFVFIAAGRERARWTVVLRLAALAGLAWVLFGHSKTEPGRPSNAQRPQLTILLDTSASMAELDGAAKPSDEPISRLNAVSGAWLTGDRLDRLRRVADVEFFGFDQQARLIDPDHLSPHAATGQATRLFDALTLSDSDVTLLLSDGHDTTGLRTGADAEQSQAGRLYAVPVGASRSAPDVALQAWPASDRLFEDQATTIDVSLYQRGLIGQQAIVELSHNGEVIDQTPLTLDQTGMQLSFEVSPQLAPGKTVEAHHYSASIRLVKDDESYTDNNAEDLFIQISRGRIKVLLIEGEPYWDTRSLGRLVGSHPRFDLTAVYGFGDQRRSRIFGQEVETGVDPVQSLTQFDIVLLGRQVDRLVDEGFADRLAGFVRSGGAVVMARGRPFASGGAKGRALLEDLDTISPVAWAKPVLGAMRVRVGQGADAQGPLADLQESSVLSRLPGMLAATRIDGRKAATIVLLEQQSADGPAMAALTTLRVGSGVVMAVLTEGLWRWELLPGVPEGEEAESIYGVFWVRALQWLASGGAFLPGQDIAIEADRLSVEPGQSVTFQISTRYIETQGLDLNLQAIDATGQAQAIELSPSGTIGGYTASFTPDKTGVYTFVLTAPGRDELIDPASPLTTRLAVVQRSAEGRDMSARPELLKQITEPTGGRCLAMDEDKPLIEYLQSLHAARQAQDRVDYDFNTWPIFAWIAGCFGLEWILRRRSGLR